MYRRVASLDVVGPQIVRAYLLGQHFEDSENSCPMIALPGDVARRGVSAKGAFETVFEAIANVLERSLVQNRKSPKRRNAAQSIAALSTGGMIMARTIADRALADELRAACTAVAFDIGVGTKKQIENRESQTAQRQSHSSVIGALEGHAPSPCFFIVILNPPILKQAGFGHEGTSSRKPTG